MGVVIEYGNDSRTQGGYNARMRIPLASAAGHLDYEHSVPQDVLDALALHPAGTEVATGLPDAGEIGAVRRAAKHVRKTMRNFARQVREVGYAGGSVDPGQAAAGVFAQVLPILGGLMGGVFGGPAGAALGSAAGDAGAMGVRALAGQGTSVDPSQMVDALTRQLAQAMGIPGSLLTALAGLPTKKSIGAISMGAIPGVTRRASGPAAVSRAAAMPALAQRSFGPVQPSRRQLSDPTPPSDGGGTQLYPGGPLVNYTAGGLLVDASGNVYDPHSGQQTGNIHSAAFAPINVGPEGLVDPNTGKAFPRAGVVSTPSVYAFDPNAGITVSAPPGGPPQQAQPSWSGSGPGGQPQAQGPQATGQTAASTPVAPGSSQGPTVPLGTDAQGNNYAADPSTGQVYQQDAQGNVSTSGDPAQWQAALDAFGVDPNALAAMAPQAQGYYGYDPTQDPYAGYGGYGGQDPYAMAAQGYGYDPTTGQYEDRYGNIPNVNDYAAQEIDQSQQGTTQELSGLIAPDTFVHSDDWFQLLGAAGLIASLMAMRRGGVPIPDDVVDLLARAMARVELLACAALGIASEDYVAAHCAYLDSRSPEDRKAGDIVQVIAGVEIGRGRRRRAHGRG